MKPTNARAAAALRLRWARLLALPPEEQQELEQRLARHRAGNEPTWP